MDTYSISRLPLLIDGLALSIENKTLIGNQHHPLHNHDFCEIFLVEEGRLYHHFNGRASVFQSRSLGLVMPTDTHLCKSETENQTVLFTNVAFAPALFDDALSLAPSDWVLMDFPVGLSLASVDQESWDILMRKLRRLQGLKRSERIVASLFFKAFLLDIIVLTIGRMRQENIPMRQKNIPNWLHYACTEMRKPVNYTAGLPRFMELAQKSQEHLSRSLKRYYGVTPSRYITSLRLHEVANLLRTSDRKVLDIYFDVGFNSPSYAAKQFVQRYGVTPGKYRQLNRMSLQELDH